MERRAEGRDGTIDIGKKQKSTPPPLHHHFVIMELTTWSGCTGRRKPGQPPRPVAPSVGSKASSELKRGSPPSAHRYTPSSTCPSPPFPPPPPPSFGRPSLLSLSWTVAAVVVAVAAVVVEGFPEICGVVRSGGGVGEAAGGLSGLSVPPSSSTCRCKRKKKGGIILFRRTSALVFYFGLFRVEFGRKIRGVGTI